MRARQGKLRIVRVIQRAHIAADRARIEDGDALPSGLSRRGAARGSGTPAAAVDLPCPVGSLDDVERDRA